MQHRFPSNAIVNVIIKCKSLFHSYFVFAEPKHPPDSPFFWQYRVHGIGHIQYVILTHCCSTAAIVARTTQKLFFCQQCQSVAVAGRVCVCVLSVVVCNFHKNLIIYFRFGHTKQPTENENVFNSIEMNWPTQQWHCMPLVCVSVCVCGTVYSNCRANSWQNFMLFLDFWIYHCHTS